MKAADYARQVGDVFVLPDTCLKIKQVIDNKISNLEEIAELIVLDPALASRLLKLANSALYNFPHQIDSVSKAVLLLGETQVYNMVVAYGAADAFAQAPKDVVDLERFWESSIHAALIGKYLGQIIGIKQSEPLYLSGLLHNIGELVVAEVNPEVARHCSQYQHGILPWQQQHKLLGFSYNECSAALLSLWQLPNNLLEPIRFLHQPGLHPDSRIVQLLHISSRLALLNSASDVFVLNELLDLHLLEPLSLTRADIEEARAFASLEALSILSMLNPKSSMIL